MFKRGETYTFRYNLPFDTDELEKAEIVFVQKGEQKMLKQYADLEKDGNTISYHLTEAESLLFDDGIIRIQINFKRNDEIEKSDEVYDRASEPLRSATV